MDWSDPFSSIPGVGDLWDMGKDAVNNAISKVAEGAGLKRQDAALDVKGASKPIVEKSNELYNQALDFAGNNGPAIKTIAPQQIGILPGIGAGSIQSTPTVTGTQIAGLPRVAPTQTVDAGSNVVGAGADELRQARLQAARDAAFSPSAAAATLQAAQGKIGRQMLGVAAGARGTDRVAARRAAMLGIGANGMAASADAAVLATQEQAAKAAAYNQALGSVQAGDVAAGQASTAAQVANLNAGMSAQSQNLGAALESARANQSNDLAAQTANLGAWTDIVKANQSKDLAATKANAELEMQRQAANQIAGIQAGTANNAALINAYNAQTGFQGQMMGTALQSAGLQNTNLGVQANYLGNYDALVQKQNAAAAGTAGQIIGALTSDERAKTDVEPLSSKSPSFASGYSSMLADVYGLSDKNANPWAPSVKGQDFLQTPAVGMPAAQPDQSQKSGGGLLGSLGGLAQIGSMFGLSDERTKSGNGAAGDMAAWADDVDPISFRYKPGFEDGGERGHVGVSAQQLESTGPLGEALVHKDANGLRSVNYPELAFAMAVGAKERADEALAKTKKKEAR